MSKIAPETLAALRFLRTNGASIMAELRASIPGLTAKTMANLLQLGYALRHEGGGYTITPKGRERSRKAEAPPPAKPVHTPTRLVSSQETDEAILDTLARSNVRLSLSDLARRACIRESMIRPALTMLVQAGTVVASHNRVPMYSLPRVERAFGRRPYGEGLYDGAELRRTPGVPPERFAAFDLPSRVNNRLHWPDGRVTPFPQP